MIYKFIDNQGTFIVKNPQKYNLYFPLTNQDGSLLSSISPNLAGDIKKDNDHFLTPPASIEDLRGNLLCRRDFFIRVDKQIIRLSYPYHDTLEAGFLYHKIIKEAGFLHIEILNFIPYNLAVEVMWIRLINKSKKTREIIPTSFIPLYGRPERNLRDHRHVTSLLNRITLNKYGILLKPAMIFDEKGHHLNQSNYFVLGFEEEGRPPLGQFPTLDYFCGGGDWVFPDAIERNKKPINKKLPEFDGKEACAAFRFRERKLKAAQEVNYFLVMGIDEDKQKIKNTFFRLDSAEKIKQSLEATKKYWRNYLSQLEFDFQDKNFNHWLIWVRMQSALRKLFGCSFLPHFDYGKGGRGWRDLWQDALTLLLTEPQKISRLILNNFKGVRIDGSNATIIIKEGEFISDRNRINRVWMDHGVWPYLTLRLYLNKTGDLNILLKNTTYFKDHLLCRAKEIEENFSQADNLLRTKKNRVYQGSILEHILIQNLVQFFNVGQHNIIRLENADWNDGLDMAGQKGESVTFSFMYCQNLADLCIVLEKLKEKTGTITVLKELTILLDQINTPIDYTKYKEKQKRLAEYLSKTKNINGGKIELKIDDLIRDLKEKAGHLSRRLRKEWLKEGFFNGYYDNQAKRVEGKCQGKIRMMLPSQVFAIMSGVAGEKQIKETWVSIRKYLKDKKIGGFRLNTDFSSPYFDLGRAFGFAYGNKENGAIFNHMVVMLANALYKRGFIQEGFEVVNSIYKMATQLKAGIYPMIPEYFDSEGKGLYLYLTGSASWYIHTLIEEILGIKFIWGDIYLEPKLCDADFLRKQIQVSFNLQKKSIRVVLIREGEGNKVYRIKEVFLNGKEVFPLDGKYIIKKENFRRRREITLRVCLE